MKIPVLGMDPSMTNWGMAEAVLDLETGYLSTPSFHLIQPEKLDTKQVRKNSSDLFVSQQLAEPVITAAKRAKAIFVEVPHGSQSARAMASYGICVGILGAVRALGIQLIEVSASENKKVFTGNKNATKEDMINMAVSLYPQANWPLHRGVISGKAEHLADALAAIHAGVQTPVFQNLMQLFEASNANHPDRV